MRRLLPTSLLLFALILLAFIFIKPHTLVHSAASHVVISEVQITGTSADDEFVELYNPTANPIDMTGWRLTRKNSSGSQTNLVSSFSESIPAFGYYLIAKDEYDGSVTPDRFYSASSSAITSNNTIVLYSDAGTTVVDKVGFGTSPVSDFETATFSANPAINGSIERKALVSSTSESMNIGGSDELLGNGNDTDNNNADFVIRAVSDPQNSSMSENPNPPTSTPTPTEEPTPTPTEEPTPSPTEEPTPNLTPTSIPTLTPTLTPTPAPFKVLGVFNFPNKKITCGWIFREVKIGFFMWKFPRLVCK